LKPWAFSQQNSVKALRKTIGVAQKQKRPATKRIMNALLSEIQGDRLIDIRNRALLAIGYAGAFRRSELAALNVEDIEQDSEGVYIIVRKSKTDQEGQGMKKFIYYGEKASQCPVRLLEAWIRAAEIKEGALFRRVNKGGRVGDRMSDKAIYNVVKDTARKAGFDEREFGGHSLRAGLITQLADDGVEERDIMRHSGHKSVEIMRRYIREVDTKKKSPTKGIL
jgi:integrase